MKTEAFYGSHFSPGRDSIMYDKVKCLGREHSLSQCRRQDDSKCSRNKDVGIRCGGIVDKV